MFIILVKALNILLIINLIYKVVSKIQKHINIFYFLIIIVTSLIISLISNFWEINIIISLLLIISVVVINNFSFEEFCDMPVILINNGKVNISDMIRYKYSLKSLLTVLKDKSINSVEEVDLAILEKDRSISIFVKYDNLYNNDLSLIVNGNINYNILKKIKKNSSWLEGELKKRRIVLKEVVCAFFSNNFLYIIKK